MARRRPGANIGGRLQAELEAAGDFVTNGGSLIRQWTWELGSPVGQHDPGHVAIARAGHVFTGDGLGPDDLPHREGDASRWPYVNPRRIRDHKGCVCWRSFRVNLAAVAAVGVAVSADE